jgi:hypothetical protein
VNNPDPYFGNLLLQGFQEAAWLPLPSWGAPTAAWYVLLALLLGLLLRWLYGVLRAYQANAYRRAALTALQQLCREFVHNRGDFQRYVQLLMVLLKSTALQLAPRPRLAALDAEQCLHYLNSRQQRDFFCADSLQLAGGAYRRSAASDTAVAALERDIEQWLRSHKALELTSDD